MKNPIKHATNDSLPSINFLKKAFAKFEKIQADDYESIINSFVDIFGSYPPLILFFSNGNKDDSLTGYRVISEEQLSGFPTTRFDLNSFSHPPPGIAPQQRFNMPGFPVLYLASDPHTAIQEKFNDNFIGKTLYISKWEIKNHSTLSYILLGYKKHFNDPTIKSLSDMLDNKLDVIFRNHSKEKRRSLKYFVEKLTDLSLKEEFDKKTSALGHYYFYRASPKFDSPIGYIGYPSLKKKRDGYNFAVNPVLVSNKIIQCTEIQKIRLNSHAEIGSHLNYLEIGNVKDNKVFWKELGYKFQSVSFYDINENPVCSFEGEEIERGGFVNGLNTERISAHDFIYKLCGEAIIKQGIALSKEDQNIIVRNYKIDFPKPLIIKDTSCNGIKLNVKFQFHHNLQ